MHLVEVDVVGLHPPQAVVAGRADVARREPPVVGPLRHRPVQLGRQHDLLAPPAALREPAADDLLGGAGALVAAVAVGGVEEVDAELEGPVHDRVRLVLGRLRPEVHRAEAQLADLRVPSGPVVDSAWRHPRTMAWPRDRAEPCRVAEQFEEDASPSEAVWSAMRLEAVSYPPVEVGL